MANVLLLRAPTTDSADSYEDAFRAAGYHVASVPVLETVFANLDILSRLIRSEPMAQKYTGVIMTSARACEAWKTTVATLVTEHPSGVGEADWLTVPFYVVGQATASALSSISEISGDRLITPKDIRGSANTGTSERLARFIVEDLKSIDGPKRLLYLTGDKNRDTLPNTLEEGGIELESLMVYETRCSENFESKLEHVKRSLSESDRFWIAFFAPSAAEFALPMLKKTFNMPILSSTARIRHPFIGIVAIGPTTSTHMTEKLGLHVDVVSKKPSAEDLVAAVLKFEGIQEM